MALLRLLILSLTFNELMRTVMMDCSKGYYQPDGTTECKLCTTCEERTGSIVVQQCTKKTDTKCKCREGFAKWDDDFSTCKCNPGYGKEGNECLKCKEGYFNNVVNECCKKWKDCESAGVKVNGNSTSDVICNPSVRPPSSTNSVPQAPPTDRPHEGITTQKTTTTTLQKLTSSDKVSPNAPSNTGSYIGMALVVFGIGGLLVLTALTCKMHITPYWKTAKGQKMNSSCRKPIEEIGDVSDPSAKLNPGEP